MCPSSHPRNTAVAVIAVSVYHQISVQVYFCTGTNWFPQVLFVDVTAGYCRQTRSRHICCTARIPCDSTSTFLSVAKQMGSNN